MLRLLRFKACVRILKRDTITLYLAFAIHARRGTSGCWLVLWSPTPSVHHFGRNAALQCQPASQPHGHEDGNCGEDAVPAELKWAQLGNHRIESER
jgi:hypothetical protein